MVTVDFAYMAKAVPLGQFKTPVEGGPENLYENAAAWTCQRLLAVASANPVAFCEALDAYREDHRSRLIDDLVPAEEHALLIDNHVGITLNQWRWAIKVAAALLEQPPVPKFITVLGVPYTD